MSFQVVIPARYASTRLPGKPLLDICGLPMIEHVRQRALATGADRVIVATDDQRVADVVSGFGGEVCMTSPDHQTGTDRLAEVAKIQGWSDDEIVVNVQGDEPLLAANLVEMVAVSLAEHPQAGISTLASPIGSAKELFDPNAVKVVLDQQGYAMYFSRAPIPWDRDGFAEDKSRLSKKVVHLRHVGLYAYRVGFFAGYTNMTSCEVEAAESLEQLRALWSGVRIHVSVTAEAPGHGVDTAEDLERVRAIMSA